MGITSANKVISTSQIPCDGSLKVTLALTAAPNISANPTDIVLVLDCSTSMTGAPFDNLKHGAKTFIDIIEQATDGTQDGEIGSGSHIGIVSFSTTAIASTQLITSVDALKTAVNDLTAGGSTNHADAFSTAVQLFDQTSGNQKVIVMFTDGNTTVGVPPAPIAAAARDAGVMIYCIGLVGSTGLDIQALNDWATDPDISHVAVTPDETQLDALFAELAANISKPGATDICIDEMIHPDFIITSILPPEKGTASMINATTLKWCIDALGKNKSESAVLEFFIKHIAGTTGTKAVNYAITYTDAEKNQVDFPSPVVAVDCPVPVRTEPCPKPVPITVGGCTDSLVVDLGDAALQSLGRIVQLDVTLQNVCPHKRVALAIVLTELDQHGEEHPRGMKTLTIPAPTGEHCQDVLVKCIKFVLPEDLDVSGGSPNSICNPRNLQARVIAHYIDTDFACCGEIHTS